MLFHSLDICGDENLLPFESPLDPEYLNKNNNKVASVQIFDENIKAKSCT